MFSGLSLSALIELCRVLRHYLGAGLSLPDVFRQQQKRGPASVRAAADRIAAALEGGDSLEQALKRESKLFPPLFLSLASVGERTGMLPEVFADLEKYFLRQKQLRQQFIARSAWPVIQFVLAVFIIALVLFVLGQIGTGPTGKPFDPLGLGLVGTSGALIFLGTIFGTIAGVALLYALVSRTLGGRAWVDRFLLSVPALGPCLQALALGRFCLAFRLTLESGMPIRRALRLSLRATDNSAFMAAIPVVEDTVEQGDDLSLALARTRLLPEDFQHIITVGEESGQLSEVLRHQGEHYHEEASRRMGVLTSVAAYGVWAMTGLFIIVMIFRFYMSYINLIDSFVP
jgi:type II secretory pathway component PulF